MNRNKKIAGKESKELTPKEPVVPTTLIPQFQPPLLITKNDTKSNIETTLGSESETASGYVPFGVEEFEEYPRISDIEACIKETVVGQDELIKRIATSLYNAHYMDIKCVDFIIGGSGTGKTLTMEAFCKEMGLAYTIENATQYTQEGYVGESVSRMLSNLFKNSGKDFQKAERGILIIDEIGKKTTKGRGKNNDGRDVSGEGVLDSLLPILSGSPINIKVDGKTFQFETRNLRIFLMDACSGIEEIKEKRLDEKSFGFNMRSNKDASKALSPEKSIYTKEDLIEYGFTPEFVGRISKIHVTNPIDTEALIRIQKESKDSVFRMYERGLANMGITLITYPDFFKEVAEATLNYGTGARELANTTNYVFEGLMHAIYDYEGQINVAELREGITKDNSNFALY